MGDPTDQSWADATLILMKHYDSSSITAFLAEASAHQDTGLIFKKMLEESNSYSGGNFDKVRRELFHLAPAEIQAEYLKNTPDDILKTL